MTELSKYEHAVPEVKTRIRAKIGPWLIALTGILYSLLPVDIIPDIPFIGWVDDYFILTSSILYLLENETGKINKNLYRLIRLLRIISMVLGGIATLLMLIFGTLIISIFK